MKLKEYIDSDRVKNAAEFAQLVGVSSPALSLYISGDRTPRPAIAKRIIEVTGGLVSYEDLYGQLRTPIYKDV